MVVDEFSPYKRTTALQKTLMKSCGIPIIAKLMGQFTGKNVDVDQWPWPLPVITIIISQTGKHRTITFLTKNLKHLHTCQERNISYLNLNDS